MIHRWPATAAAGGQGLPGSKGTARSGLSSQAPGECWSGCTAMHLMGGCITAQVAQKGRQRREWRSRGRCRWLWRCASDASGRCRYSPAPSSLPPPPPLTHTHLLLSRRKACSFASRANESGMALMALLHADSSTSEEQLPAGRRRRCMSAGPRTRVASGRAQGEST